MHDAWRCWRIRVLDYGELLRLIHVPLIEGFENQFEGIVRDVYSIDWSFEELLYLLEAF
jgi:hypothetical protein